ncbi:MAG: Hsp70 family protein, partial [Nitrospira sp.]
QDDLKKKDLVEAKNIAEQLVYTAEKSLKDAGEKVPADLRASIENKITDTKNATKGEDMDQIKKTTSDLSTELQKIGEMMSKASTGETQAGGEAPKDGPVRDADFEEKKVEEK